MDNIDNVFFFQIMKDIFVLPRKKTSQYSGTRCYIPTFKVIVLLVPEQKKIFKVFNIYGRGGHLGHVTWTV